MNKFAQNKNMKLRAQ